MTIGWLSESENAYNKMPVITKVVNVISSGTYLFLFGSICRYKKKGRGYITLDDFGTYEGMQNPNYDGEL